MVKFSSNCLGASLLIASSFAVDSVRGCKSRKLTYPIVIDMDELSAANEALTLDLEWMEVDPGFTDQDGSQLSEEVCDSEPFMTRALGGSVPGPTLTVSPGTSMKIKFKNNLTYQPESHSSRIVIQDVAGTEGAVPAEDFAFENDFVFTTELDFSRLNKFNDPDVANLHFHGLHVPGVLPGDDTTLEVLPQEEYEYVIDIPEDHEPGLHWVHPHHHGSSTLHLVGGAALALIVKDSKDSLPVDIREATERVMVFQDWDINEALQTARHAEDKLITESFSNIKVGESIGYRFVTVNGQYQPITEITVGKWERWRFLYAGWQDLPLEFGFSSEGNAAECEFHLLAKDGIYLSDYPRGPMLPTADNKLPIPPGGRADFMVRCNKAGETTRFEALSRSNTLVVNCVEEQTEEGETAVAQVQRSTNQLTPWSKTSSELPDYLQSVMDSPVSSGCNCEYTFDGYDDTSRVNGRIYRPGNNFVHTSYLGAVVERSLKGMHEHSYHQHVYPYQLVDFPNKDSNEGNEYFKIGDWHDTYLDGDQKGGRVSIRYKATDMAGKIMVHCHNALHADNGMIQKEYVRDITEGGSCMCDIFGPIDGAGIFDDITTPKVIGAIEFSAAKPKTLTGFVRIVPVLVAGALWAVGF